MDGHGDGREAALDAFSAPVRRWFAAALGPPTPPQALGWPAIARGGHVLVHAETGSGKTLAAFLWCLDRLSVQPVEDRTFADRRGSVLGMNS